MNGPDRTLEQRTANSGSEPSSQICRDAANVGFAKLVNNVAKPAKVLPRACVHAFTNDFGFEAHLAKNGRF